MSEKHSGEMSTIPKSMRFVFGGCSAMMSTTIIQPLDLVKTRMQNPNESLEGGAPAVMARVVREEGVRGLYKGLTAALLRQATYGSARLGTYMMLFESFTREDGSPPDLLTKMALGMVAGACGAFIGNPADISLIRMTSDGALPPEDRRNYANAFDAVRRISAEEGVRTLWRGVGPTMSRAAVLNAAQLSSYSQAKEAFKDLVVDKDGLPLHFMASVVSGLVTTVASLPVDIAKTRIQNMSEAEYTGALNVVSKVVKEEGFLGLWKGFLPYYLRVAPHTILTFIFLEQFNRNYRKHVLGLEDDHSSSGL